MIGFTMKFVLLTFIGFFLIEPSLQAQLLYPEVMEARTINTPQVLRTSSRKPLFPRRLSIRKKRLYNSNIENPGVRYAVQNLKKQKFDDPELTNAFNTLLHYSENDTIRKMVHYMKNYMRTSDEKEKAIEMLNRQVVYDSIEFYRKNAHLITSDMDVYLDSDLKTFASYIQQDSNYIWLRDKSRDSVLLEVMNLSDNAVRFWLNNGRSESYRFWATNRLGDSIGAWIQVMPNGNNIRVYVDDDVYQTSRIENQKTGQEREVPNRPDEKYFTMNKIKRGELSRRHWTYYSEIEAAMGQGYLANWAGGGENSLSLLTNIRYFMNYNKNKTSWENFMHYRLGFLKSGSEGLRKNDERLEFNSKLGQKAFKHWFYTTQFNLQTIIFNSYEYPTDAEKKLVGNFMTPAYFTLSLGLDYKPNDNFSLYLSPIAGKWTWVRDTNDIDYTRYGVENGKKSKSDAGARLELRNKFKMFNIMDIRNELILFSSYYNPEQRIFCDWKVQIDFKINYFMRASVYTNVVYDQNYSYKLQFKENLNLGVNFRF